MIVVLDEMYDVRNSEHPSKERFFAVPKGGGNHTWEEKLEYRVMGRQHVGAYH
jgi:hypothetical protein